MEIIVHDIAKDGLPDVDNLTGRVAFIFDGCIVSGWPLDDGESWEADSDVGRGGRFYGVTHWVEFPAPVWDLHDAQPEARGVEGMAVAWMGQQKNGLSYGPLHWTRAEVLASPTFDPEIDEAIPLFATPNPVRAEQPEGKGALTFDAFRKANVARCVKWHPEGIASWSPSDWLTAVTGELGELASLLKMRNRERDGLAGNKFSPTDRMVADELADVLTYLDLLAAVLDVDLGQAAVRKFNEVSERVGFPDRIELAAAPAAPVGVDGIERLAQGDYSLEFYGPGNHGGKLPWLVAVRDNRTDNADEYEGQTAAAALAAALAGKEGAK